MLKSVETVLCYPTWLIVRALWNSLPAGHVWRRKYGRYPMSPGDWARHATDLTMMLSFVLWMWLFAAISLIITLSGG